LENSLINIAQQLKHLITEFADITDESQGLPPHRGYLRRNRLVTHPDSEEIYFQCLSMRSLNDNVPNSLKKEKYGSQATLMLLQLLWFESQMDQSEFVLTIMRLMNTR
jgi:hypothetical protein